ncbi:MAG: glycosyltransferase [Coriobacteriia bacterium]|nr:glycosyltransferase [Coriobacteriia bacterium]
MTHAASEGAHAGPLRILLISNMWPSAGSSVFGSFVARQVAELERAGADVTVVANTVQRRGAVSALAKYVSLDRRARTAARAGTFDVVVGHFLYPTAAFARTAARIARVPLVLVSHGTDARSVQRSDFLGRASRRALEGADLVVTVSNALRETLRTEVDVPVCVPIEVVNMGFDADRFRPDANARKTLGVPDDERVVLYAGNLEPVKRVEVLISAFARLVREGRADRLIIVGGGSLRESLGQLVTDADIAGSVTFVGQLPQEDLVHWMNAADAFVLPSRSEGLGTVLLEAMACGTPCVASRVGGVPEVLDESCGRLVPSGDEDALRDAIDDIVSSGKHRYRDACLARAAQHTSAAKAREFLAHLERLVGGHGR